MSVHMGMDRDFDRWLDDLLEIEREHYVLEMPSQLAPDVGECFEYDPHGEIAMGFDRSYRVAGWVRLEGSAKFHCTREEATHVIGKGVCGVVARVSKIRMVGRVSWSEELLEAERRRVLGHVGRKIG